MLIWRELILPFVLSSHLLEDHIVHQIKNYVFSSSDKSEDHIEIQHQDGKRSENIFCSIINIQQS